MQEAEFLHSVEILDVAPEYSQLWVNMLPEEVESFLPAFGFGLRCELVKSDSDQAQGQPESSRSESSSSGFQDEMLSDMSIPYLSWSDLETLLAREDLNGTFRLNIQSISRSAMGIDRYVVNMLTEDSVNELPFLAFAGDCVFRVNRAMNAVHYEDVDFEEFAALE